MRIPEYLSPTSVKLFVKNPDDFYLRYLADTKMARDPQTQPMAAGSAFDAYVKSYLHTALFGKGHDVRYELGTIFTEQVEAHNRDWAWENGKIIFDQYKEAGCLGDLVTELEQAIGEPRFEFTVKGAIEGVTLMGKPDIFFINKYAARVVYDWKVNGYCSPRTKSPMKGYVKLRTKVGGIDWYPSIHKKCELQIFKGIAINSAMFLEDGSPDWADQLSIYAWLLGEEVGSEEVVFGIDQVCGPATSIRFATHRLKISPNYQYNLLALVKQIWSHIHSGWIFHEMSKDESAARCAILDKRAEAPVDKDFELMVGNDVNW